MHSVSPPSRAPHVVFQTSLRIFATPQNFCAPDTLTRSSVMRCFNPVASSAVQFHILVQDNSLVNELKHDRKLKQPQ
jgi:hypothetical protein